MRAHSHGKRTGVEKYSNAHAQKDTWPWLKRSQCTIVAMPNMAVNTVMAMNPRPNRCHWRVVVAR